MALISQETWCRIGFHDWETVRTAPALAIEWEVIRTLDAAEDETQHPEISDPPPQPPPNATELRNRVCLDCGATDLQIDRYRAECLDEQKRRRARQKRASMLVGESDES